MVGLPVEELLPFAIKDILIVMVCPLIETIKHLLDPIGICHRSDTIAGRSSYHAATCQELVLVDHRRSTDRIADKFEVGIL